MDSPFLNLGSNLPVSWIKLACRGCDMWCETPAATCASCGCGQQLVLVVVEEYAGRLQYHLHQSVGDLQNREELAATPHDLSRQGTLVRKKTKHADASHQRWCSRRPQRRHGVIGELSPTPREGSSSLAAGRSG
jgi:hypothetical protein